MTSTKSIYYAPAPTEVQDYPAYYGFDSNYKTFLLGARQDSIFNQDGSEREGELNSCVQFKGSPEKTIASDISLTARYTKFTFNSTSSLLYDTADFVNNTLLKDPLSAAAKKDILVLLNRIMAVPYNKLSKLEISGGGTLSGNLFDFEKVSIQRGIFHIVSISEHFFGSANSLLQDTPLRISHLQDFESVHVSDISARN